MDDFMQEVRSVYEGLAGRPLTDSEVADIALTLRQFAAFLIDCARDEKLRKKLGILTSEPSAAPRVINNTTQNDGEPLLERFPTQADPPTGAPHRDSTHHESSAPPAVLAAVPPGSSVEATLPGQWS